MLLWSAGLVLVAMACGGALLARHRGGWWLRAAHGLAGAAGLAALLAARTDHRAKGAASMDAALLLGAGLAAGLYLATEVFRERRPMGVAIALHVALAGLGGLLVIGIALR